MVQTRIIVNAGHCCGPREIVASQLEEDVCSKRVSSISTQHESLVNSGKFARANTGQSSGSNGTTSRYGTDTITNAARDRNHRASGAASNNFVVIASDPFRHYNGEAERFSRAIRNPVLELRHRDFCDSS